MNSQQIIPGQIVKSKAGRDKNMYFIVISTVGSEYALITDGDRRKIEKPKKKKMKHLAVHNTIAYDIKDKIESNVRLNNSDIKNCLKLLGLVNQLNSEEV